MRLRHVAQSSLGRITRRYTWLRHITPATIVVTLIWLYFIHSRERSLFESHIRACDWQKWESWHKGAQPHRSVFIADPQLVDPHTYPGRPWPLSSWTEYYTDLYMRRNFKLINQVLDPDSIVFLGDLFDGGREWSTERARGLNADQRKVLINLLILEEKRKEGQRLLGDGTTDLNQFVAGENGKWKKWKQRQWDIELDRFARIFLNEKQLYPRANRSFLPAWELPENTVSIENGAKNLSMDEYATAGTKSRVIKTSLPGNHDLGFGSGVQITVRDRFESRFGETNSVYVLGNHTFVSLDSPSLSAYDEYVAGVGEVSEERRAKYSHLWKPTHEFLDSLDKRGPRAVAEELDRMFPGSHPRKLWSHELTEHKDDRTIGEKLKPAAGQLMKRGDENERKPVSESKKPMGPQLPVVLLSHVPLYRNPDVDCGKLRERGKSIPLSAGYQYQNVLTPTLTSIVAKKVSAAGDIVHVFSGDDHDYCDVTHRFNIGRYNDETKKEHAVMRTVREVTVKSFSWAMGVRKPGFMLVSMWNPVDEHGKHIGECMGGMDSGCKTVQTELCLLPDQLSVFINYAQLLGLTIMALFVRAAVLGIRDLPEPEEDESQIDLNTVREKVGLPRLIPRGNPNGRNGSISPRKSSPKPDDRGGRGRASSTSTGSANASSTSNQHLSVQRSYNARTRTVSPAVNSGALTPNHSGYVLPNLQEANGRMNGRGLIEKAGYYPAMRWRDPDEDEESDEESHVGSHYGDFDDGQAKGGKVGRRKPNSRARRALDEFLRSMLLVAVPAGLWYGFLVKNG